MGRLVGTFIQSERVCVCAAEPRAIEISTILSTVRQYQILCYARAAS